MSALVELSCFSDGSSACLKLGNDLLGQNLAEFHAPLIEGIDLPDRSLGKDAVLVERNQFSQRLRRKPLGKDSRRRPVAFKRAMRHEPLRRTRGPDFFGRAPERQRLSLREHIGQQQIVVIAQRIEGFAERNEIARDELCPLMYELVERVLPVGARLPQ